MKLEQIINGVKEKAKAIKDIALRPVTFKEAVLYAGITLSPLLMACENRPMISPLAPSIENTAYLPTETKFSGDSFQVEFQPLEKPYQKVEARGDKPTQPMSDWIELQDGNEDGKYAVALSSTPFYGDYNVQFKIKSGDRETESPLYKVVMNMNEAQSDTALQQIIAPLVKAGSTTDGDIIAASYNQNHFFGGNLYNNDCEIRIYDSTAGGNQRDYIIDVQGSISDTFNSQKKTDADASSISYTNIGTFSESSPTAGLEAKINELQSAKWTRTD